ncbi:type II toxin-antitoxin system VapC family toxin [Endozoicomonas sp. GU-1]|uniref:type II toxin-antitoxin system VapC family toxin n=1 Tax=Endozoicomonas sp. GU-1 TaxID=3009078 RepID=UPI0022B3C8F7|nr:type II toxin-antitoxin system VapC family toxin [Endozoicomonas sp. GU-1]WBA82882.1 type II toxin-antitoxin system VapC family toxin [Endozoicomonas sp. GU-1]WBA85810.1 type II toxin-antitoxin system VapC family toxin [Endozoicomonas sp. GU-1]
MYLIDTNVIGEIRKKQKANPGVQGFFKEATQQASPLYLSVITLGDLRRGVEKIRHRGDTPQAKQLEHWLKTLIRDYSQYILEFGITEAQIWGKLRVPYENAIEKQIAATAITYGLTLVTRNTRAFINTGVNVLNPFWN